MRHRRSTPLSRRLHHRHPRREPALRLTTAAPTQHDGAEHGRAARRSVVTSARIRGDDPPGEAAVSQHTTAAQIRQEVRYRFGPHPHGGFILGFRLAQLGGFILAGAIGIALMSVGGFLAVLLIALDFLIAAGVLVIALHGHTVEEWTPLCIRFLLGGSAAATGSAAPNRRRATPAS